MSKLYTFRDQTLIVNATGASYHQIRDSDCLDCLMQARKSARGRNRAAIEQCIRDHGWAAELQRKS